MSITKHELSVTINGVPRKGFILEVDDVKSTMIIRYPPGVNKRIIEKLNESLKKEIEDNLGCYIELRDINSTADEEVENLEPWETDPESWKN